MSQDNKPVDESCANCRFAKEIGSDNMACRFGPATPLLVGSGSNTLTKEETPIVRAYFPMMSKTEWCGRFEPRPTIN